MGGWPPIQGKWRKTRELYVSEVVVEDESRRPNEIFYAECVDGWVVCRPKGACSRAQETDVCN